jgi:hypothetical protein
MLTDAEVERIRQGVRDGIRGPIVLSWVDRLLQDRDERIRRDREIAARLLAPRRNQRARGHRTSSRPRRLRDRRSL